MTSVSTDRPDWSEHMPTVTRDDLDAIEAEFLKICGRCDAGLVMACVCSDKDFRPTMSRLLAQVETLRTVMGDVARQLDALPGGVDLAAHLRAEASR